MTQVPCQNVRDNGDSTTTSTSTSTSATPANAPLHTAPDCAPAVPSPPMAEPTVPSPSEREAKLKAEARAYALSGTTNEGKNYKRKLPLPLPVNHQYHPHHHHPHPHHVPHGVVSSASSSKEQGGAVPSSNGSRSVLPPAYKRPRTTAAGAATAAGPTSTSISISTTIRTVKATDKSTAMPFIPIRAIGIPPPSSSAKQQKYAAPPKRAAVSAATVGFQPKKPPRPPTRAPVMVAGGPLGAHKITNTNNINNSTIVPLPINSKDYDPEYLRMIQSLGELDDFSIWDNLDNVEDEEFRLSDLDDDDEEMDYCEDDDEDDEDDYESLSKQEDASAARTAAAAVTAVPGTPGRNPDASATDFLRSPKSNSNTKTSTVTPSKQQPHSIGTPLAGSSPSLNLPGWDDEREDGGEFYKNLEEELGSLLEEDLEAAVQSLYTTKSAGGGGGGGGSGGTGGSGGGGSSKDDSKQKKGSKHKALTKKQLQQQQRQKGHHQSQNQIQPQSAFVASTTANAGTGSLTPVTAATLVAAEAKRREQAAKTTLNGKNNNSTPGTPLRETARQGNSATVTYQQSQQLRTLMRKHYQLLAQQAILSVRAAQSIKSGGSSSTSNSTIGTSPASATASTSAAATLPASASKECVVKAVTPVGSKGSTPSSSSPSSSRGGGDFLCGENETDLTEILDLAVGMLQDLDQNRKDAIRTSIQLAMSGSGNRRVGGNGNGDTHHHGKNAAKNETNEKNGNKIGEGGIKDDSNFTKEHKGARRSLMSQFAEGHEDTLPKSKSNNNSNKRQQQHDDNPMLPSQSTTPSNQGGGGRLTRAAFRKLQAQPIVGSKRTAFDIPGLMKLDETFSTIDDSVNVGPQQQQQQSSNGQGTKQSNKVNILEAATHSQACRDVLKDAGANVVEALLPGVLDVSENFTQLQEHLGNDFESPCSSEQLQFLRKNRNLFTSGEDNLVLRGVNLYGEKQWILIGDRYLPDRSINIISQRYSKLCVMLYKAHGIDIDAQGNLLEPPKLESVDDIDEDRVKALGLKLVEPPAILNVHRWSMEEDLSILKAVPIMGHMWAELGARLIPHRDRGHLRKRYQVLERRVKATITRGYKTAAKARSTTKSVGRSTYRAGATKSANKTPTKASPKTLSKATVGTAKSPGRSGKKMPLPAKSPSKAKTKSSPGKRKATGKAATVAIAATKMASKNATTTGTNSTSPMMSLESAAASLARIKPKETEKEAASVPKPPTKSTAKRAILHRVSLSVAATEGAPAVPKKLPSSSARKSPTYPQQKKKTHPAAVGADAESTKYGSPQNMPHAHPQHPHYPYAYHGYPGYYQPTYQYPPHPHPATEENNIHPALTQNTPPPPPGTKPYYPKPDFSAESKHITIASPKPSTSRSLPKEMDTPNSKSFMRMMGEDLSALGGDGDVSRQAYEKLFDFVGGSDEGSQLLRMKEMMENEDVSEAVNAISHLSKSPGRGSTGLSNFLGDPNSNITGISILNEMSKQLPGSKDESSMSIMARVLGSSSSNKKELSSIISESMPSPSKKYIGLKDMRSPTKGTTGSFFRHTSLAPETPQKSGFFSTAGTPLGLSPGLRTLRASALLKDDGIGETTNLTAPFSPVPSSLMKTDGLATNLSVPYSPAPSIMFRGFDDKTGDENRFAFDQDSRFCEDSNQLGDLAVGATLSNADQTNGNSLSIAQEEFDAISGLGALSNSPFKTVKSFPRGNGDASEKKNKKSKSFFARVVGDSKEKSPQKKLHF